MTVLGYMGEGAGCESREVDSGLNWKSELFSESFRVLKIDYK